MDAAMTAAAAMIVPTTGPETSRYGPVKVTPFRGTKGGSHRSHWPVLSTAIHWSTIKLKLTIAPALIDRGTKYKLLGTVGAEFVLASTGVQLEDTLRTNLVNPKISTAPDKKLCRYPSTRVAFRT
eukprot:2915230-Rhodomonas_salina.1